MTNSTICPICGGREVAPLTSAVGKRAYCQECFHGWRVEIDPYRYDQTAMCPLGTDQARLDAQVDFFAPFLPPSGAVLEIGCATGELARSARARLPISRYEAIELSPAAEAAQAHVDRLHGAPLPDLLAAGEIEGPFDVVLMSHVLEHIEAPWDELDAIVTVMSPDGALFLEVPNASGNRRLPIDDNRSHLHFFSVRSLSHLLALKGLDTVATATDAGWMHAMRTRFGSSPGDFGRRSGRRHSSQTKISCAPRRSSCGAPEASSTRYSRTSSIPRGSPSSSTATPPSKAARVLAVQ